MNKNPSASSSQQKKIKFLIDGMHCLSCEKLLEDEFSKITGVEKAKVNYKQKSAEIWLAGEDYDIKEFEKVALKHGYQVLENKQKPSFTANGIKWLEAALIASVIFFVYWFIQRMGILDKINLQSNQVSLGLAFLIGLAASVSSCLAVVGIVVLAFGEKYQSQSKNFFRGSLMPNFLFHAGRLATFFVLGGFLGIIGGQLNISGNFIAVYTIIIALVFLWLGLNILGFLPSIGALGVRMPKKFSAGWDKLKKSEHRLAPFILGGLSFFLPCGFTQSMQIFALASGSFLTAGLSLLSFALGTMPVLFSLGIAASWAKSRKILILKKAIGFVIIIFAFYTLQSGLAVKGINADFFIKASQFVKENGKTGSQNIIGNEQSSQVVEMRVTSWGFEPSVLKIKNNIPVKFIVRGDQITGCTNKIVIPSQGIAKNLAKGENVIEFTPSESGTVPFSCWMGMVRGKFIVE